MDQTWEFHGTLPLATVGDRAMPQWMRHGWVAPEGVDPAITVTVGVRDGVPECREIRITSQATGRPLRDKDLKDLRVDDEVERILAHFARSQDHQQDGVHLAFGDWMGAADSYEVQRETLRKLRRVRKQANSKITPAMLQEVAQVYRENVADRPTEAVARHFGKGDRTGGLYIKMAREKGFLGAAIPGRAGEQ